MSPENPDPAIARDRPERRQQLELERDRQRVERANRLLRRKGRGPFFVWGEADHHTAPYRRHDDIGIADSESITKPELSSLKTGVDHRHGCGRPAVTHQGHASRQRWGIPVLRAVWISHGVQSCR